MNQLNHLAIIPDGNRRWAKHHNRSTPEGHLKGYQRIKQVCDWCLEEGIKFVTIYAFSYENWRRQPKEVSYLMKLFLQALNHDIYDLHKKGFRIKIIGNLSRLSATIQKAILKAETLTQRNSKGTLIICFSYGGRQEIVDAVKNIVSQKINLSKINENLIDKNLYYPSSPAPDLIIRTGGQKRLSNLLIFQSAYSEINFTDTLWPDFSHAQFKSILKNFHSRIRNFGK